MSKRIRPNGEPRRSLPAWAGQLPTSLPGICNFWLCVPFCMPQRGRCIVSPRLLAGPDRAQHCGAGWSAVTATGELWSPLASCAISRLLRASTHSYLPRCRSPRASPVLRKVAQATCPRLSKCWLKAHGAAAVACDAHDREEELPEAMRGPP